MSLLVVGSVALDSIFTPFGETADALGGSAVYFSVAGSLLHPVQVVGRGRAATTRWPSSSGSPRAASTGPAWSAPRARASAGRGSTPTTSRAARRWRPGSACSPTSSPSCPTRFRSARVPLPRQHRSRAPARRARAGAPARARRVRHDELLDPEQEARSCCELLSRVDVLMVNDSEARELSGDWNIHRAGRWILAHGPKRVVIKQGEHGALLIEPEPHLLRAGLPAGERLRSHRRGRRLRRRLHGATWPAPGRSSEDNIRRAMVVRRRHGLLRGRAVRHPGLRRRSTLADVEHRVRAFPDLTHVAPRRGARVTSAGEYAAAGVDLASADDGQGADRRGWWPGTRTALSVGQGRAPSAAWCGSRRACGGRRWC